MTRRFFLIGFFCAALALGAALAGGPPARAQTPADGFIGGIEDLPLMAGLAEDADATLVFETPEGRIVEADAEGAVSAAAVRRFYDQTLPQLGWEKRGPDRFQRDDEILKLDFSATTGATRVRFRLGPRP